MPVWHASVCIGLPIAALSRPQRRYMTRLAAQTLDGVGTGELMIELGQIAIHVRKHVTASEGAAIGGAEDVRDR